jgi:cytochrome b6-f complex iron-sulfur subunit
MKAKDENGKAQNITDGGHPGTGAEATRERISRRTLLGLGWFGFLISIVGPLFANVRFLFPNVVYEPPARFKISRPEDYPVGSVTFIEKQRVFIFHEPEGFRVISAICTHLRCTVNSFEPPDDHYPVEHAHCPCHGSVFARKDGRVLQGPAPRPLEIYLIDRAPDGRLAVDTGKKVRPDYVFKV